MPPSRLHALLALPTPAAARALIGWELSSSIDGSVTRGRIVETEAYLATDDLASHSANGPSARNASMFLGPGRAYVYLIYGIHHCLNVVTMGTGTGEAVLVRALEPLSGQAAMRARRGPSIRDRDLCRGPGRLCQALGIDRAFDGHDLARGALRLVAPRSRSTTEVDAGPRVGITKSVDLPLRFSERHSPWTSRGPKARTAGESCCVVTRPRCRPDGRSPRSSRDSSQR